MKGVWATLRVKARPAGAPVPCPAALRATPAYAAPSAGALAEERAGLGQNAAGKLIGVPFQNGACVDAGALHGTHNALNLRPMVPISVSPEWTADVRNPWSVPVGAGVGRNSRFARLPVNGRTSACGNALRPDDAPNRQRRPRVPFMRAT